ncbi:Aminoacyl-tRNA editing domain containing protein [Novymonas esmeraldas]|uniref:Aminoacyl-tRNA editing domain containing protein n=1 Tax=Novymonas esmeraldas TaxID=1808958 RepID=A0AAW0ETQ0_9TRYP
MSVADCRGEAEMLAVVQELQMELPTITHGEMHTVEEANKELDRFGTPCVGTKNMFLKSKKGELLLLTAVHTTKTDMKMIQKAAGTKDLRFAPPDVLSDNLGVVQGSVTPFALINNIDKHNVTVLLDAHLQTSPIPFVLHPCRNDKSCLVTFPQLERYLDKLGYTYKLVDFGAASADTAVTSGGGGGGGGGSDTHAATL